MQPKNEPRGVVEFHLSKSEDAFYHSGQYRGRGEVLGMIAQLFAGMNGDCPPELKEQIEEYKKQAGEANTQASQLFEMAGKAHLSQSSIGVRSLIKSKTKAAIAGFLSGWKSG